MDVMGGVEHICPNVANDDVAAQWIDWALAHLDLEKSAGYDGSICGCSN